MWKIIQKGARRPPSVLARAGVALAAAAVVLMVVGAWSWWSPREAGALAVKSGELPKEWSVAVGSTEEVDLADGSSIELLSDSRLEVLTNTGSVFVTSLKRGVGAFEVKAGGPRQWVVDCGFVAVEVVGTRFRVQRDPDKVTVAVERGKVRLRGEGVDRLLTAGESTTVENPRPTPGVESSVTESGAAEHANEPSERASEDTPEGESEVALAPSAGVSRGDDWERLLRRADSARRNGDRAQAMALLRRVARDCPDQPRRKLAAFTLARLQMDEDPSGAAETLSGALDDGMTRGLRDDAMARLVEAYARAGDREEARRVAAEYEYRYPRGRHLDEVRHWASQ